MIINLSIHFDVKMMVRKGLLIKPINYNLNKMGSCASLICPDKERTIEDDKRGFVSYKVVIVGPASVGKTTII